MKTNNGRNRITLPYPEFSSIFSGIVLFLKMKKQKLKYNIRTYNCLDPVGEFQDQCLSFRAMVNADLMLLEFWALENSTPWACGGVSEPFSCCLSTPVKSALRLLSGALSNFQSLILNCCLLPPIEFQAPGPGPWPSPSPGTVPTCLSLSSHSPHLFLHVPKSSLCSFQSLS